MALKTTEFDAAKYLTSPKAQDELLADAIKSKDAGYIANALGVIARARGMSEVAGKTGLAREALYKSLSASGDPRLTTLLGVADALGITIAMHVSRDHKKKSPGAKTSARKKKAA
jgi:probable addiction module antidote protein